MAFGRIHIMLLAALGLGGFGGPADAETYHWVQYVSGGLELRSLSQDATCPTAQFDGKAAAMSLRARGVSYFTAPGSDAARGRHSRRSVAGKASSACRETAQPPCAGGTPQCRRCTLRKDRKGGVCGSSRSSRREEALISFRWSLVTSAATVCPIPRPAIAARLRG